jgi:hypothetical protein
VTSPRSYLLFYENIGASFTLDGDDLVIRPTSLVTPGISDRIRENKAAIMEILRERQRDQKRLDRAAALGLVAKWSGEFGYVSIHDPTTGEWWDIQTKDAPPWAVSEAHKRKALRRAGDRRAYRLTSREMEEIWEAEHSVLEEGIVEEHPVEES